MSLGYALKIKLRSCTQFGGIASQRT